MAHRLQVVAGPPRRARRLPDVQEVRRGLEDPRQGADRGARWQVPGVELIRRGGCRLHEVIALFREPPAEPGIKPGGIESPDGIVRTVGEAVAPPAAPIGSWLMNRPTTGS